MGSEKLNILFVGNLKGTSTSIFYYSQLVQLGHVVYPFEPNYYQSLSLVDRVSLKLNKRPRQSVIDEINQSLLALVQRNAFDVIFIFNENFFDVDFFELLRRKSKKSPVLLYHSHDNLFAKGVNVPKSFLEALPVFDFVFTTKTQNVAEYKKLGQPNTFFLPSAFEPTIHRPIPTEESQFESRYVDLSFIGTFDKSRLPTLEAIGYENLHIWGEDWKKFSGYTRFKKNIHARGIYFLEYSDVLSHSHISLGLLREGAADLHTQRTFEIPACRSLQIAPKNSELISFFEEDKEIVLFSSLEELRDKVSFYKRNKETRDKIVGRAFEKVYAGKHTYFHRVTDILRLSKLQSESQLLPKSLPKAA